MLKQEVERLSERVRQIENSTEPLYTKVEQVPAWARPTIQRLVDKKLMLGDEHGNLNLDTNLIRALVILERAGAFD